MKTPTAPSGRMMNQQNVTDVLTDLAQHLTVNHLTLATAESCTGGWIAKCCTDLPGSSSWFLGGIVAYTNDVKSRLLDVPPEAIEREGAVSQVVVEAMATGARVAMNASIGIAVTGIAGPDGGSVDKPVGTVWIGWAGPQSVRSQRFQFYGDRTAIRWATVLAALSGLRR